MKTEIDLKIITIKLNRLITILLGLLWLIDGILQFQPAMFTKSFVSQVLSINLQGQPLFIPSIINFGIHLAGLTYFWTNMGSAVIQVIIGVILLLPIQKRYQRVALYLSIVWALIVWVFGEGLGNIFTGMASFYTGAPGSVTLYLILAVFLLYPERFSLYTLPKVAGALFLFGAILNLLPMFWTKAGFTQMMFQMSTNDSLSWISTPAKLLTNILASSPVFSNVVLVLLLAFFGVKLLLKPGKVIAWSIIVFLILVWWFGQDLGGLQTFPGGTATDPNSVPLYILFILPLFYTKDWNINVAKQQAKKSLVKSKNRMNLAAKIASVSTAVVSLFIFSFAPAFAHVIVHPDQTGIATQQEFTITMPNEKNIPTVALKLLLPPGLMDVVPNMATGWTVSTQTKNNRVTEIDWTNGDLPVGQRVDFLFQAQVPPTPTTLKWKAYQTYSDGEVVSWDQTPASGNSMDMDNMKTQDFSKMGPYSTTQVINDLTGSMAMSQSSTDTSNTANMALGISILAGVFSVVAIGMLLKQQRN